MNHSMRRQGTQRQGFPRRIVLVALMASLATAGCGGDYSFANGIFGNIKYTLFSKYYMTSDNLREVHIVTGHEQYIDEDIVSNLAESLDETDIFEHRLDPAGGTISGENLGFHVTIEQPGTYNIRTYSDGELIDEIPLIFDRPASLELLTWVYDSSEGGFSSVPSDEMTTIMEGSQATFLNVPLDADGERLAGDINVNCSAYPASGAVFTVAVDAVYENAIWYNNSELSVVFTEPGLVTVTCTDTVNDAKGSHLFDVQPIQ